MWSKTFCHEMVPYRKGEKGANRQVKASLAEMLRALLARSHDW
jgi:hypothetical protein